MVWNPLEGPWSYEIEQTNTMDRKSQVQYRGFPDNTVSMSYFWGKKATFKTSIYPVEKIKSPFTDTLVNICALVHKTLRLSLVLTAWQWQIVEGKRWEGGQHVSNVWQIHCTHRKIKMNWHKCQYQHKVSNTVLCYPCLMK